MFMFFVGSEFGSVDAATQSREKAEAVASVLGKVLCGQRTVHKGHATFSGNRFRLTYAIPWRHEFNPKHPLDTRVPQNDGTHVTAQEETVVPGGQVGYQTHDEALTAAAEHNVRQMEAEPTGREQWDWALAVEVGDLLELPTLSVANLTGTVGWEEARVIRPIRVVTPRPWKSSGMVAFGHWHPSRKP